MAKNKQEVQPQSSFDNAKLYTWVKALEVKINKLTREFELIKNESIRRNNDNRKDFKHLTEEVLEFKNNQDKISQKMDIIIKELKKTAGIEEVQVLKKYIEFWNPLNFVTQKDLDNHFEAKKEELLNSLKDSLNLNNAYTNSKEKK